MSEPERPDMRYRGTELPADVDRDELLPLVRIEVSALPVDLGGPVALVVGLEVGHPLDPSIVNAREVFAMLHGLLPDLERKLRRSWVEHRRVCAPGEPVGEDAP